MSKIFNITILTLYPEVFPGYLGFSLLKKALDKNMWSLQVINIRDFATDKYKKVDDYVFGGGKGLLLKPDVLGKAIDYALANGASKNLIYPSPQGKQFNHSIAQEFSTINGLTFICGHFEGIDQRIIEAYNIMEISLGDYILSGGELASMIIIDSTLRLLPNMINSHECTVEESFSNYLLEYPQYTKPAKWQPSFSSTHIEVPDVLISGDHGKIKQWRTKQAEIKTKKIRPDLWDLYKYHNQ